MMTFILSSCDKDPIEACAEDPTCEYFRCKVNGEWWTPDCEDGPLFGCRHTDVQYYYGTTGYIEFSSKSQKNDESMSMRIESVFISDSIYSHYLGPNTSSRFRRGNNKNDCQIYKLIDQNNSTFLLAKIDTVKFIIEGKFSFSAKNECNEIIDITDGSFRQRYRF